MVTPVDDEEEAEDDGDGIAGKLSVLKLFFSVSSWEDDDDDEFEDIASWTPKSLSPPARVLVLQLPPFRLLS